MIPTATRPILPAMQGLTPPPVRRKSGHVARPPQFHGDAPSGWGLTLQSVKKNLVETLFPNKAWIEAAKSGDVEMLKRLWKRGDMKLNKEGAITRSRWITTELSDRKGYTALQWAVRNHQYKVIDWLADNGADFNDPYHSVLPMAVETRDHALLKKLLSHGADLNAVYYTFDGGDCFETTPLYETVSQKSYQGVKFLLDAGANPNNPGESNQYPLLSAAFLDSPIIFELLLARGATVEIKNRWGGTLLTLMAQHGNPEQLARLVALGLPLDARDNERRTALHQAVLADKPENVHFLLKKGADPFLVDFIDETPLTLAIRFNKIKSLAVLMEHFRLHFGKDQSYPLSFETLLQLPPNLTEKLVNDGLDVSGLSESQKLVLYLNNPAQFLAHFTRHLNQLELAPVRLLYNAVEYKFANEVGLKILPELLAMMNFVRRKSSSHEDLGAVTGALTKLFGYIQGGEKERIEKVFGVTYNNWANIGTLGLSFARWKFDAMQRWKNAGPMTQPSLLEKSGLFKQIPARPDDATYHRGFLHHDPKTGLSVEMRRAYTAISKPDLGTLVIRNSSHHFGRNLLPMPAYYSGSHVFGGLNALLDPADVLKADGGFEHVLSKTLNAEKVQVANQEKIAALLQDFDTLMTGYVDWKCGFKKGVPPSGFEEILKTALMSAKGDGVASPFGKVKNLRLAWVNPYDLPAPVAMYDMTAPAHQQEVTRYLDVLQKRRQVGTSGEYTQAMPDLIAFLNQGLSQGLELTLTE